MSYKIYLLTDQYGTPFYIGETRHLKERIKKHRLRYGKNIRYRILQTVPTRLTPSVEYRWINKYRSMGYKLKNKRP